MHQEVPLCFAATPFGEIWCTGSGSPPLACEVHPCCAGIQEHPKATAVGTSSESLSAAANPTRAGGVLSTGDSVCMPFIAAQELEMTSKGHLAAPVVSSSPYNRHYPHHHLCHMGRAHKAVVLPGCSGRDNLPSKQERGT